jgi:predicted O-methyltransferase YrrM
MAVSLELAAFLAALCESARPCRILDVGSGFTSYVFRRYIDPTDCQVWSVDDDPEWLDRTAAFLRASDLPVDNMLTWEEFRQNTTLNFDLVCHDIGNKTGRAASLPAILSVTAPGGLVIIDDLHKPRNRPAITATLQQGGHSYWSLRGVTLDSFGRYALLARKSLGDASLEAPAPVAIRNAGNTTTPRKSRR